MEHSHDAQTSFAAFPSGRFLPHTFLHAFTAHKNSLPHANTYLDTTHTALSRMEPSQHSRQKPSVSLNSSLVSQTPSLLLTPTSAFPYIGNIYSPWVSDPSLASHV